jgi:hypothetical protein
MMENESTDNAQQPQEDDADDGDDKAELPG